MNCRKIAGLKGSINGDEIGGGYTPSMLGIRSGRCNCSTVILKDYRHSCERGRVISVSGGPKIRQEVPGV